MLTQSGVKNKQYVLPLDCFKNMEPFHRIRISKHYFSVLNRSNIVILIFTVKLFNFMFENVTLCVVNVMVVSVLQNERCESLIS